MQSAKRKTVVPLRGAVFAGSGFVMRLRRDRGRDEGESSFEFLVVSCPGGGGKLLLPEATMRIRWYYVGP